MATSFAKNWYLAMDSIKEDKGLKRLCFTIFVYGYIREPDVFNREVTFQLGSFVL